MARNQAAGIALAVMAFVCSAAELHVGAGQAYDNLRPAADAAQPGDTIVVHDGTYAGGQWIEGLQGTADNWIAIVADDGAQPVWDGGSQAWHLVILPMSISMALHSRTRLRMASMSTMVPITVRQRIMWYSIPVRSET